MNRNSCAGCHEQHSTGYVFDNPALRICRQCRSVWLTFLRLNGFVMADTNDLVNELCEDSHFVPAAAYEYHDAVTPSTVHKVLRLKKQ